MKKMNQIKTMAMAMAVILMTTAVYAGDTTLGASITLPLDLSQAMKRGTFSLSVSYQGGGKTYNTYNTIDQSVSNATTSNSTTTVDNSTTSTVNQNSTQYNYNNANTNTTYQEYNYRNNYGTNGTYINND